ncbi:MAG TPA: hypothetical protein VE978_07745 [Chitinophagales bacterium]|nr:hypothetical protein [Chitinophagales bacterium]
MNTAPKEKPADKNQPQVIPREKNPPVKQPPVTFPKTPAQPEQKQKRVPTKYDFEKVNPAQEHHRNTWDQSQPSRQNVPRNPAPAQPKQPQPKKSPRE